MDLPCSNCQGLERVVVFQSHDFTWSKSVRKLSNSEDSLVIQIATFFRGHILQEAEIVIFDCDFPASRLKFAVAAVPIEDQRRGRRVEVLSFDLGAHREDSLDEAAEVDGQNSAAAAVDYPADPRLLA